MGATLDRAHAIVVLGDDHDATARVAIGIGRAQAGRRRVAIGDLLGEAAPFQSLISDDDPHGLVDSFLYGVSLNRVAHAVPGAGELFVMPTGTEPPTYEEILPNDRWRRLAGGFREVGALLVLAVPASAARVEDLVAAFDGAVLVGEMVPSRLPVSHVIAGVRAPRTGAGVTAERARPAPRVVVPVQEPRDRAFIVGGVLVAALVGIGIWLAARPLADGPVRPTMPPRDTPLVRAGTPLVAPGTATGATDSLAAVDTTRPPGALAGPIVNPGDSAAAAGWAVGFKNFNTPAGVLLTLHSARNVLPAATYAPVQQQGARWYQLIAGAFTDRRSADSLLAAARQRRSAELEAVAVVRLPLAFLVHPRANAAEAPRLVGQLVERGHPAYALRQADGTINVYVGAFESPSQATLLATTLQASGLTPTLAYRLGRVY